MGEKSVPCNNCYSTGKVPCWKCGGNGGWYLNDGTWQQCNVCWGNRELNCHVCDGKGYKVEWSPYNT